MNELPIPPWSIEVRREVCTEVGAIWNGTDDWGRWTFQAFTLKLAMAESRRLRREVPDRVFRLRNRETGQILVLP